VRWFLFEFIFCLLPTIISEKKKNLIECCSPENRSPWLISGFFFFCSLRIAFPATRLARVLILFSCENREIQLYTCFRLQILERFFFASPRLRPFAGVLFNPRSQVAGGERAMCMWDRFRLSRGFCFVIKRFCFCLSSMMDSSMESANRLRASVVPE
jgi:hypothetical protein